MLKEMHLSLAPCGDGLRNQRTFALTGLGVMGKTQTAIRYVFRYRDLYKVVLWAHADGQAKLAESFSLFAKELGLPDAQNNPAVCKQAVKECLEGLGKSKSQTRVISRLTSQMSTGL